ncbi:MAG: TlpA family protein disulfide reductase [bacterium]|nr:TlpA family protein disulfide reductase [bacterium]
MEQDTVTAAADRPRRSRFVWILASVAIAAAAVVTYAASRSPSEPGVATTSTLQNIGDGTLGTEDQAPDFSLATMNGASFALYDHLASSGEPVLLNLWASWCPPCRAEMPALNEAAARHPNVEFVGVAVQDDPVAAENFAKEIGVSYTIGFDDREEVYTAYETFGLPMTYIISSQGVILEVIIGEVDGARIDTAISTWFGG